MLPRDEALTLVAQHSRNEPALVDVMLTLWDANRRSELTALLHHVNARVLRQYACALAYREEADAHAALHWLRAHGSSAWANPFADVQVRPRQRWIQELL